MQPVKCLRNNDSMGILFPGNTDTIRNEVDQNVNKANSMPITLSEYGLCLQISNLAIPVQESMFEHLASTGLIRVYAGEEQDYEMVLVYNIPVDPDKLNQAIGAYKYKNDTYYAISPAI